MFTNLKFPDGKPGGPVDNGTELVSGRREERDVSAEVVPAGDDELAPRLDGLGGTEPPVESGGDDTMVGVPLLSS